jgi:hypothetical protein
VLAYCLLLVLSVLFLVSGLSFSVFRLPLRIAIYYSPGGYYDWRCLCQLLPIACCASSLYYLSFSACRSELSVYFPILRCRYYHERRLCQCLPIAYRLLPVVGPVCIILVFRLSFPVFRLSLSIGCLLFSRRLL